MYTILLYISLCTSPSQCDAYEADSVAIYPASWTVSTQQEENEAFEQCAKLERKYMSMEGYKESDCYVAE